MVDGTYLKVVSSGDAGICKVYGLQVTQIVAVKRHKVLWSRLVNLVKGRGLSFR